ncbi:MAG: aminotransferase class I/II-fold pyridoxal phosphate-dependent enzyme, partial [Rhodobacteraceae bacterium]|nr:aminotransferase class I/II-fold pyridoxal phosphate-dependent enzyme [Paracoccaceae bacterium]
MTPPPSVPFFRHALTEESAQAILDVIHSPFITTGQVARDTQALICDYLDVPNAKLTNSWTNGAVATLLALGIGPGDEVIVPAMTFVATANVVELVGARPVFVDVEPDTLLIDIDAVRQAITPRTRAVIPVHLYGQMVDIAKLRAQVGSDIAIIEDAAHCFEGSLNGD